jgi:general secretion pathway protein J
LRLRGIHGSTLSSRRRANEDRALIWNWYNGFTLLELLVAMALLVILTGALYSTYFSLMNGRASAMAGMESRRELRTTLDMLRREITSAYYNKLNQASKKQYFVVEDRDFFGKPSSILSFTAIAPPDSSTTPISDLVELKYQPIEKDNKILLTRQAKDFYLDLKPYSYPQMDEVEGFLVECFDGGKWIRSWDTKVSGQSKLPDRVRITLRVKEGGKIVEYTAIATPRVKDP